VRRALVKHILIVNISDTILGSFRGILGVMPFFGKAPLETAEGRLVRY